MLNDRYSTVFKLVPGIAVFSIQKSSLSVHGLAIRTNQVMAHQKHHISLGKKADPAVSLFHHTETTCSPDYDREAQHLDLSREERKHEELRRIAGYVAMKNPLYHIQIHVHAAHGSGATPEEIYREIDEAGGWAGGAARQNGMEAWRLVFRPDLPSLLQIVELTDDSLR